MEDTLVTIGIILAIISIIAFAIGFIMLFFENQRKLGLKILLFSVIGFVIGFGTCVANFSLGGMH
ncbi:MAG: hypothetical protein O9282_05875 [Flavobacterium sp.]|jgi:hypothetical protein|uniref:hypothetical protein n=1 Tax=Flavobacterium sp. TaxID=239 RepID=UPI0022C9C2F2|nr:hypothetical protein [Flavobacterium sp.]MCZ8330821.1 hypothetical protein [Flavobacterium sp.]